MDERTLNPPFSLHRDTVLTANLARSLWEHPGRIFAAVTAAAPRSSRYIGQLSRGRDKRAASMATGCLVTVAQPARGSQEAVTRQSGCSHHTVRRRTRDKMQSDTVRSSSKTVRSNDDTVRSQRLPQMTALSAWVASRERQGAPLGSR